MTLSNFLQKVYKIPGVIFALGIIFVLSSYKVFASDMYVTPSILILPNNFFIRESSGNLAKMLSPVAKDFNTDLLGATKKINNDPGEFNKRDNLNNKLFYIEKLPNTFVIFTAPVTNYSDNFLQLLADNKSDTDINKSNQNDFYDSESNSLLNTNGSRGLNNNVKGLIQYSPVFFNIFNYDNQNAYIWGGVARGTLDIESGKGDVFFDVHCYRATSNFKRISFDAKIFSTNIGYMARYIGCSFGASSFDLRDASFVYKTGSGKSHKEEFTQDDFLFNVGRAKIFVKFDNIGINLNSGLHFGAGLSDNGDMYYFYGKGKIDWAAGCEFGFKWNTYPINKRQDLLQANFFYTRVNLALATNDDIGLGHGEFDLFFAKLGYKIEVAKFGTKRNNKVTDNTIFEAGNSNKTFKNGGYSIFINDTFMTGFFITPHFAALSLSGDFSARVTNETQMYLFFPYKWFNARGDLRATFCNAGADFLFNWTRDKFSVNLNYLFLADFSVDFKSSWLFKKNILFDGSNGAARGGFKMDDVSYNSLLFFAIGYEHRFYFSRHPNRYRHLSLFFNKTFLMPLDSGLGGSDKSSGGGGSSGSSSSSSPSISLQDVASYLLSLLEIGVKLKM